MTNAQFAKENKEFISSCEKVGLKNTTRQASKYRRGKGKAYKVNILRKAYEREGRG